MVVKIYFSEEDKLYYYEGTQIFKNKYGITDAEQLKKVEEEIVAIKIAESKTTVKANDNFDFEYFKWIHKFLFEELYEWAGEIRKVRITKGNFTFAFVEHIENQANKLFFELKEEQYLQNDDYEIFIKRVAYYMSELNVIHPFREGNGRVNRLFFRKLAEKRGYDLNFQSVGKEQYLKAIILAAENFDCSLLEEMLKLCIKRVK